LTKYESKPILQFLIIMHSHTKNLKGHPIIAVAGLINPAIKPEIRASYRSAGAVAAPFTEACHRKPLATRQKFVRSAQAPRTGQEALFPQLETDYGFMALRPVRQACSFHEHLEYMVWNERIRAQGDVLPGSEMIPMTGPSGGARDGK